MDRSELTKLWRQCTVERKRIFTLFVSGVDAGSLDGCTIRSLYGHAFSSRLLTASSADYLLYHMRS